MSKQIFKYAVPIEILTQLLDKICEPCQKEYIIDINAYKRMKFHNYHIEFLNTIEGYYHYSKKFYAQRDCTYNSFMTIVRHICRANTIEIHSSIKYDDSSYNIEYKFTPFLTENSHNSFISSHEGSQIDCESPKENN
jgi:hypothetical protein